MNSKNKNNIKYYLVEFFAKLGIMCVMALTLGIIEAIVECMFLKDISFFIRFTMGYISCLIFNWRWFTYAEREEKR